MMRLCRILLFNARYEALRAEGKMGGAAYEHLCGQLTAYKALLGRYAIKQDEVERAKRVAHVCGLEMMTKKPTPRPRP